jgi:hypothetical protein
MDNISAVRSNMQDENLGSELSLHVDIKFAPGNDGDDEVPHSNPSPQRAMSEQAEDIQSINTTEASCYDRPSAIDPEDNQYRVEKLVGKRRLERTFEYEVKWQGYPDSENTWEKRKDIDPDIVAAYETSLLLA